MPSRLSMRIAAGSAAAFAAVIVAVALFAATCFAEDVRAGDERAACLKCHAQGGGIKRFPDGKSISTYVDGVELEQSVHGALPCTACHKDFASGRHPDRAFRNKPQYLIRESHGCRGCHSDAALRRKQVHEELFAKEDAGDAIVCTNCHGAHAIRRASHASDKGEDERCMGCHEGGGASEFLNGEQLPVHVDLAVIGSSAHHGLRCMDCHYWITGERHPRRNFRSLRDYQLATAEICRRCHFDKYSEVSESIHYDMLRSGNLKAPTCIDCHGGHSATSPARDRMAVVRKCRACHGGIYETYAASVHGSALIQEGNRDVPICTDCHSSHSIKRADTNAFHQGIPDTCSACHSNPAIMSKYGLSTDVVRTYLADFHGVTMEFYRKQGGMSQYRPAQSMAVCTDCHGTHDIMRMSGSDTKEIKARLLERCRNCHHDATEQFPDAWLSHYRPSLKVAPMVFIVEKFYGLMMPLMVVGLILQILLHIWRYLVSR